MGTVYKNFECIETCFEGLYIIKNQVYKDERGYFEENFHKTAFMAMKLPYNFVQDNYSVSRKGVIRGLHFQIKKPQGKLLRVVEGEIFDVAVDLRKSSPTFGKWFGTSIKAGEGIQVWIPKGFAHGFQVLSDYAKVAYKCTDMYDPLDESGVRWNDAQIDIKWKMLDVPNFVSEKDENLPLFQNTYYFK